MAYQKRSFFSYIMYFLHGEYFFLSGTGVLLSGAGPLYVFFAVQSESEIRFCSRTYKYVFLLFFMFFGLFRLGYFRLG